MREKNSSGVDFMMKWLRIGFQIAVVVGVFSLKSNPTVASTPEVTEDVSGFWNESGGVFAVTGQESLRISVYRGNIRYNHVPNATEVKVRVQMSLSGEAGVETRSASEGWRMVAGRHGKQFFLESQAPPARKLLEGMVAGQTEAPLFTIEISGASLPLELTVRSGDLVLRPGKHSVVVTSQSGVVDVKGGEGELKVHSQQGTVSIDEPKGGLYLDGYSATWNLKKVSTATVLRNFSGRANLSDFTGTLTLKSFKGSNHVLRGKGRVEFDLIQGQLQVAEWEGGVVGATDQGQVVARMKGSGEVRVQSESAAVTVALPKGSGAKLNVGSVEGKMFVPPNLGSAQYEKYKVYQGKLKGGVEGSLFVRSKTGDIKVITP